MKYAHLLLFFIISTSACGPNKKDTLISAFDAMYENVAMGEYQQLYEHLDIKSQELLDEITNPKNQNINDLISVGNKYKLKYLCVYFSSWSKHMSKNGRKEDFFKFLTQEGISFFDPNHIFQPLDHRCTVGPDNNFVAFYFPKDNTNVMDWSKWNEDGENSFRLDLIYTLRLNERRIKRYFNYEDRIKKELSLDEWLREIYKGYISNDYNPTAVNELIEKRRIRYKQSKSI